MIAVVVKNIGQVTIRPTVVILKKEVLILAAGKVLAVTRLLLRMLLLRNIADVSERTYGELRTNRHRSLGRTRRPECINAVK